MLLLDSFYHKWTKSLRQSCELWAWKPTTQSSILAWKIPWTEEPGGLQVLGSQRGTTKAPSMHMKCGGFSPGIFIRFTTQIHRYLKKKKLLSHHVTSHQCNLQQQTPKESPFLLSTTGDFKNKLNKWKTQLYPRDSNLVGLGWGPGIQALKAL